MHCRHCYVQRIIQCFLWNATFFNQRLCQLNRRALEGKNINSFKCG